MWCINFIKPVVFAYGGRNVVVKSLNGIGHVRVFFDLPVEFFQVIIHKFNVFVGDKVLDFGCFGYIGICCCGLRFLRKL